jgi:hypothetical protein
MSIYKPLLSGLALAMLFFQTLPASAGSGGFFLPANYHPLDNPWKIALTIAVIWIIVRLRRRT